MKAVPVGDDTSIQRCIIILSLASGHAMFHWIVQSFAVASTGLGVVACVAFLMSAVSALAAGAIYETMGYTVTMYYVAALFALAAVVFAVLPPSSTVAAPD